MKTIAKLLMPIKVYNDGGHHYYFNTGMFDGVKSNTIPILDPAMAARKIIRGIEKNRSVVRMPRIIYLLPLAKGILPSRWFDVVVGKWLGIYRSMDYFKEGSKYILLPCICDTF